MKGRDLVKYLLIPLMLSYLAACSPSGENPSPLDIQRGPSSPYDIRVTYSSLDGKSINVGTKPRYSVELENVGLAELPLHLYQFRVYWDGKLNYESGWAPEPLKPGEKDCRIPAPRNYPTKPGRYEFRIFASLDSLEEANLDDNELRGHFSMVGEAGKPAVARDRSSEDTGPLAKALSPCQRR